MSGPSRNLTPWAFAVGQVLLTVCAGIMAFWGKLPVVTVIGLVLAGSAAAVGQPFFKTGSQFAKRMPALAWLGTLLVPAGLLALRTRPFTLDNNDAVLPGLIAAAVLPAVFRASDAGQKQRWKRLFIFWLVLTGVVWLADAYLENQTVSFHLALVFNVACLILCRLWFRPPAFAIHALNTLILLFALLPILDVFFRPSYQLTPDPATIKQYYSFAAAKSNPRAFVAWWSYYLDQWSDMAGAVFDADPTHFYPLLLRPGSQGRLFQSRVTINSRGFRGAEIPEPKGNAYRIVAIGESTTFDCTLDAADRPWPELLEQMIRERLKPDRPIQVINAGVPAYSLKHNVHRLADQILPLQPDMIISYHGYNGRGLLGAGLPPALGAKPPVYQPRPLKLLADSEYHLKMLLYRRHQTATLFPVEFNHLENTEYARAYEQLVRCAQTNHIRLVLANFSMSVNNRSDAAVIEFYRAGFPSVYWDIRANMAHSAIVEQTARRHPETVLVDTHPGLDGEDEQFIDLVHFSTSGRLQLAENIFAGITNALQTDWSHPITPAVTAR